MCRPTKRQCVLHANSVIPVFLKERTKDPFQKIDVHLNLVKILCIQLPHFIQLVLSLFCGLSVPKEHNHHNCPFGGNLSPQNPKIQRKFSMKNEIELVGYTFTSD